MKPLPHLPAGGPLSADIIWSGLRRLDAGLALVERVLAVVITVALVLAVAGAVVARHLARIPTQNLMEAAPLLVLWLALVGASLGLGQGRHLRLELALRLLPPAVGRVAGMAVGLFGVALMGFLGFLSIDFVRGEIDLFGLRGWAAAVFPLFFGAAALRFGIQTGAAASDLREKRR